ncbi:MAG: DUF72 domain-containing protein [Acidobacteriota bacterium]|jgi:uncharacterized protein YecE (DUF72 family)|nr:DUF72 domain-containing protein [Acidobacteriota bacterium]
MQSPEGLFFGPAGWSYADWRGTVYPEPLPRGFNHLAFLAGQFDFVEVNTSFYRVPGLKLTQGWVDKTAAFPGFAFWIKLHQSFTHERRLDKIMLDDFRACLQPLAAAGKLAGLLAQFPYSFKYDAANLDYLRKLAGNFSSWPLAVEFRHQGWLEDEVLAFFRENALVWTNIDQPQISQSLPLTALATARDTAYLRLHGRNADAWFSGQGRDARYDYSYSSAELGRLAEVVARLREQAKKVFVSGNNHYKGSAVKNLLQLKEILLKRRTAGRGN